MRTYSNKKGRVYYDLIHSLDDGGFYCQAFLPNGSDLMTTNVYKYREQAEGEVLKQYPHAELLSEF